MHWPLDMLQISHTVTAETLQKRHIINIFYFKSCFYMVLLKALCWALIFIIRIRFPPGTSLATVQKLKSSKYFRHFLVLYMLSI